MQVMNTSLQYYTEKLNVFKLKSVNELYTIINVQ